MLKKNWKKWKSLFITSLYVGSFCELIFSYIYIFVVLVNLFDYLGGIFIDSYIYIFVVSVNIFDYLGGIFSYIFFVFSIFNGDFDSVLFLDFLLFISVVSFFFCFYDNFYMYYLG